MPVCSGDPIETGFNRTIPTSTPPSGVWRIKLMSTAPQMVAAVSPSRFLSEFCSDVVTGLSLAGQKELPSKYLYDEIGSSLFDVICLLPEYGLSRAGMRMLQRYAGEIIDSVPGPVVVAELGSGSG